MRTCCLCGKTYRTGRRVITTEGARVQACQTCANSGVTVCPVRTFAAPVAERLDADEKDARVLLRALARKFRTLAKLQQADPGDDARTDGHRIGLNQAADVADAWAANPAARVTR